ncbi:MAG: threonine synthase [bacterium]|nr:threonine synthase [bacterium]
MKFLTHIECTKCEKTYSDEEVLFLCECGAPLFAKYDMDKVKDHLKKDDLVRRTPDMWRYREMMPITNEENILNLGEGFTPLFHTKSLGEEIGLKNLYLKDEGLNPTASFKARGLGAAISKANELGMKKICLPTAGNAGGAAAAYGAFGGMEVMISMPETTPETFKAEAKALGAKLLFVDGSIVDAGKYLKTKIDDSWYDVSTLKEPYRVEGKKTMGIELAEQFNWELPDVIVYPTGGGTGLIGMWKAFAEMESMGWISSFRPRMVSVQAEGCAPIIKAFHDGQEAAPEWQDPDTVAAGLRVPKAVGDFLMLRALRESGGTAVSVSDDELIAGVKTIGKHTGIFAAPEGGAAFAAVERLKNSGEISENDRVVVFITGSGLKYTDTMSNLL